MKTSAVNQSSLYRDRDLAHFKGTFEKDKQETELTGEGLNHAARGYQM